MVAHRWRVRLVFLWLPLIAFTVGGPALEAEELKIVEAVICRSVEGRVPIGAGDVFARDSERLYCFSRVAGGEVGSEIVHTWFYQGAPAAAVRLPVRSNDWRTYSSKRIGAGAVGEWRVEIRAADGRLLHEIRFMVE